MAKKALGTNESSSISSLEAFILQLLCGSGLALALWVANNIYSIHLVTNPSDTLFLIWVPFDSLIFFNLCF